MSRTITWPTGDSLAEAWGLPSVERHESIGSTQDRALALARDGACPWTAVVAHEQTTGRGRRGRPWQSARGLGLWLSLIMPAVAELTNNPRSIPLTLRLGVGLADAVARAMPEASVQLKWPNDIWLNGQKVAGILAERVGPHTIVGLGVNMTHDSKDFDAAMRAGATSLWLEGWRGDGVQLGALILAGLREALDRSATNVMAGLRARDALLGRELVCPDGRIGRGAGIDDGGALIVRVDDEEWRVTAGTIHLLPAREATPARG